MAPVIDAFTTETVMRLTGLSRRQLSYWDTTGFFSPSHLDHHHPRPFSRIYSFRDVVGLRTIALLRARGVSLQELRKVGAWLCEHEQEPWSRLRFSTAGGKVFVQAPGTSVVVRASAPSGQVVIPWELGKIAEDTVRLLTDRNEGQIGAIERRRSVLNNSYVIAGTRIPTSMIFDYHEAGYTSDQILEEYPQLGECDISAAIQHEEREQRARRTG